jgi:hypothetical protein
MSAAEGPPRGICISFFEGLAWIRPIDRPAEEHRDAKDVSELYHLTRIRRKSFV